MKLKTYIIRILISTMGLSGCTKSQPQIGRQVLDLGNPDYNMDVAYYFAEATDWNDTSLCNDTTEREIEVYYQKDTLKYYNTKTDKLYPPLTVYKNAGGNVFKEATFCGQDFYQLDMVATEHGNLVQIKGKAVTDEEEFNRLVKNINEKYGEPHFEKTDHKGKKMPKYRWETEDEYIQLCAYYRDGKNNIVVSVTDDETTPVKIENPDPYLEIALYRWKKEHHDELVAEDAFDMLNEESETRLDKYHVESALFYTPEEIKPFFITKEYLDRLEQSGNLWDKIEASFYLRIPAGRLMDPSGMTDSVKVNQEGCLPMWSFGGYIKDFKNCKSNVDYILRLMKQGKKLYEMMEDSELCQKHYKGEAEWTGEKTFSGTVSLYEDQEGNLTIRKDSKNNINTLYDFALSLTAEIKEELKNSNLHLEKTTARCFEFPGESSPAVYFTDGKHEVFMFIGSSNIVKLGKNKKWENNRIYPVLEYLKEIR